MPFNIGISSNIVPQAFGVRRPSRRFSDANSVTARATQLNGCILARGNGRATEGLRRPSPLKGSDAAANAQAPTLLWVGRSTAAPHVRAPTELAAHRASPALPELIHKQFLVAPASSQQDTGATKNNNAAIDVGAPTLLFLWL
jgi:hypothetical protein